MGISGLCAAHCLFFPVGIAILPLWSSFYAIHEWTHPLLFILILPTVYLAVRDNKSVRMVPLLLYTGLTVVGLAWLLHHWLGTVGEALVTLSGSALLVAGHWFNFRLHRNQCKTVLNYETS